MNSRERDFVNLYKRLGDAELAVVKAGWPETAAPRVAARLLADPDIRAACAPDPADPARDEAFCFQYVGDPAAGVGAAAVAAGMKPEEGVRAMARPEIRERCNELTRCAMTAHEAAMSVDAGKVVRSLADIAFSDPRNLFLPDGSLRPPSEWSDADAAAIQDVEVKDTQFGRTIRVKRYDKMKALDTLAKVCGVLAPTISETPDTSLREMLLDIEKRAVAELPEALRRESAEAVRAAALSSDTDGPFGPTADGCVEAEVIRHD